MVEFKKIKIYFVDIIIPIVILAPFMEVVVPAVAVFFDNSNWWIKFSLAFILSLGHNGLIYYLLNWEYSQGTNSLSKKIVDRVSTSRFRFLVFLHQSSKGLYKYWLLFIISILVLRYGIFLIITSKKEILIKKPTKITIPLLRLKLALFLSYKHDKSPYDWPKIIGIIILLIGLIVKVFVYVNFGEGVFSIIKKAFFS